MKDLSDEDKKEVQTKLDEKHTELSNTEFNKFDKALDDIDDLNNTHSSLVIKRDELKKQLKEDREYKETLRPMYMDYHQKLSEIDEEKIQEEEVRESRFVELSKEVTSLTYEISNTNNLVSQLDRSRQTLESEIQRVTKQFKNRNSEYDKLESYKAELDLSYKSLSEERSNLQYSDFAYSLLKDGGVKRQIVKKYLPLINQKDIHLQLSTKRHQEKWLLRSFMQLKENPSIRKSRGKFTLSMEAGKVGRQSKETQYAQSSILQSVLSLNMRT